jgi:hypothetical protein
VFDILRAVALYRYASPLPDLRGRVAQVDARHIANRFSDYRGEVTAIITSPPYLDTTNYREDQWLRLWFLGGPTCPAESRAHARDDRHRREDRYWAFLREAWAGAAPLLRDGAHVVVRIGGRRLDPTKAGQRLLQSLSAGTGGTVKLADSGTSRILNGQLQAFRPGATGTQVEYDYHFRVT